MSTQLKATSIERLGSSSEPLPRIRLEAPLDKEWDDLRSGLTGLGFDLDAETERVLSPDHVPIVADRLPAIEIITPVVVVSRWTAAGSADTHFRPRGPVSQTQSD
jgi:hypothetical protein